MATVEEQIKAAQDKLAQLKAKKQQIEAQKRAVQAKRKRADENRMKFLAGAALLKQVELGTFPKKDFIFEMDKFLSRDADRALFGLGPLPKEPPKPSPEEVAPMVPADRLKKRLGG